METLSDKSFRSHFADNLKLKCDSLPYRSAMDGNRCYFAILGKVTYSDAQIGCSTALQGSQVALEVPATALASLMTNSSVFHSDSGASEAKHTICVRDSAYKCDKGQTMIRGKCISRAETKMNFADAQKNCKKAGMELFTPSNDFDNQMILNELTKDGGVWVQKTLDKRGTKMLKSYARFSTCDGKSKKPPLYAGSQTVCNTPLAAVIDKTGYWSNTDQKNVLDVICTKNAGNEFTPVAIKKVNIAKDDPCVEEHEMDESTGKCEWTGPVDACAKLVNYWNKTFFVAMPEFPMFPNVEVDLTNDPMDEHAIKVVVRKGCMFTGYMFGLDIKAPVNNELKLAENLGYGAHQVQNYMNSKIGGWWDGLSRVHCFCDPTEATVNGHVPAPPPDKKCIEHHEFDEETQQCEWTLDPKYCGELITNENRRMRLEMPGWPTKKKYDADHWEHKRHENFHITVIKIIVRQHCFATLYHGYYTPHWYTLPPTGYGIHKIATGTNPEINIPNKSFGTSRFVCECLS